MKRHIETQVTIKAQAGLVWKVLMDFDNYSKWNPFIRSIHGEQTPGKTLEVRIQPPDGKEMTFKPQVLVVDQNKELRWVGKLGFRSIFKGEHYFSIEDQNDGTVKFIHGEYFSGILVGLMSKTLDETEIGFSKMNEALKGACENQ